MSTQTRLVASQAVALTAVLLSLTGCSSVSVPDEHYYRLDFPKMASADARSAEVLRIEDIELSSTLSGDRLLVAENSVRLKAYEFHRWISPLDRLVRDALITGLSRSGVFREVKGPTDGPGETLRLTARLLDFHQFGAKDGWVGKVTIEMRLVLTDTERLLMQSEFGHQVAMLDETPLSAVLALSEATGVVVEKFLRRCEALGIFAVAKPGK